MYRKHLRMARGKGEVESRQGLRSHFVERMVKLPMVHVAWDYAANTYSTIKESNRLVNFTLTNAEKSVTFMAGQAKPVVMKFEKQIQAVDELACKGLGALEEKMPLIAKRPQQIIGDTRDLYASTIYSRFGDLLKYSNDKIKSVTDYSLQTASAIFGESLVNSVLGSVDGALIMSEQYIDYFLPPTAEEIKDAKKKEGEKQTSAIVHLARISSTIRRRVYGKAAQVVEEVRYKTLIALNMPEVLFSIALDYIGDANQYARSLWVALSTEEEKEQQSQNFFIKRLMPIARTAVKQLVVLYISFSEILPLPLSKQKAEANNSTSNDVSHAPGVVSTLSDGVLRIIGLIRTIPALLPMYIYIFFNWLSPEKDGEKIDNALDTREENNIKKDGKSQQNHVHENDSSAENNLD